MAAPATPAGAQDPEVAMRVVAGDFASLVELDADAGGVRDFVEESVAAHTPQRPQLNHRAIATPPAADIREAEQ